ncbi:MAG: tRNA (guanine(26)-N(2))-dimethyltransferase [Halobacteria archaeon]
MARLVREGEVAVEVPEKVFYNPKMEVNRDLSVALLKIARPELRDYVDATAATGVLGLRVAKETRQKGLVLNDVNPRAARLLRRNAKRNRVACEVRNENANVLFHGRRFDGVDLDPFGSPAPFLDGAARSALRFLAVTATDRAVLCGSHPAGPRNYGAATLLTEDHPEVGLRVLAGSVLRHLALHDKGGTLLFSVSHAHFYRLWLKVKESAAAGDRALESLGFISRCACGFRGVHPGLAPPLPERCPECGKRARRAGPLHLGGLADRRLAARLARFLDGREWPHAPAEARLAARSAEEVEAVGYYEFHPLCREAGVEPPPLEEFLETLRGRGYRASRTVFSGTGLKSDASKRELVEALKSF